ncbi:hypothetical protein RN04_01970 [Arthrobacter sp. W1]|nr:hypothetical protein RN04_01970 [Arthrobacter sp. W1]
MGISWKWWFWFLPWKWSSRKKNDHTPALLERKSPLREFVYLDEVSMKSLLVSQEGALATEYTEQDSLVEQVEVAGKVSAAPKNIGAELSSRFQSSSTLGRQTLRKSIAQSQFKDLLELDSVFIRFHDVETHNSPETTEYLFGNESRSVVRVEELDRGDLIEVEVELAADPIYRFSITMTELSDLFEKYPAMADEPGTAEVLTQIGPINRMLEQLLVGLVPIRARCTNLAAVDYEGQTYLAKTSDIEALSLDGKAISVVGVTNLDQYWKDVRRVLFSQGTFKMLCRVARKGLHDDWSPVKGAEVLSELVPQFPSLLESVGRTEYSMPVDNREQKQQEALVRALDIFANKLIADGTRTPSSAVLERLASIIDEQRPKTSRVSEQRSAFDAVHTYLRDKVNFSGSSEVLHRYRDESRNDADLKFSITEIPADREPTKQRARVEEKLLDVEIVAIYW